MMLSLHSNHRGSGFGGQLPPVDSFGILSGVPPERWPSELSAALAPCVQIAKNLARQASHTTAARRWSLHVEHTNTPTSRPTERVVFQQEDDGGPIQPEQYIYSDRSGRYSVSVVAKNGVASDASTDAFLDVAITIFRGLELSKGMVRDQVEIARMASYSIHQGTILRSSREILRGQL